MQAEMEGDIWYKVDIERDEQIVRCRVILGEGELYAEGERYQDKEGKIYIKHRQIEMKRQQDIESRWKRESNVQKKKTMQTEME